MGMRVRYIDVLFWMKLQKFLLRDGKEMGWKTSDIFNLKEEWGNSDETWGDFVGLTTAQVPSSPCPFLHIPTGCPNWQIHKFQQQQMGPKNGEISRAKLARKGETKWFETVPDASNSGSLPRLPCFIRTKSVSFPRMPMVLVQRVPFLLHDPVELGRHPHGLVSVSSMVAGYAAIYWPIFGFPKNLAPNFCTALGVWGKNCMERFFLVV